MPTSRCNRTSRMICTRGTKCTSFGCKGNRRVTTIPHTTNSVVYANLLLILFCRVLASHVYVWYMVYMNTKVQMVHLLQRSQKVRGIPQIRQPGTRGDPLPLDLYPLCCITKPRRKIFIVCTFSHRLLTRVTLKFILKSFHKACLQCIYIRCTYWKFFTCAEAVLPKSQILS